MGRNLSTAVPVRRKGRSGRLAIASLLAATAPAAAASYVWDAGGGSPTAPVDGGGDWDVGHLFWVNGGQEFNWSNGNFDTAVFAGASGTPGTVNVVAPVSVGGLTFNYSAAGNYTIAGTSPITLGGSTTPTITINGAAAPTITAALIGSNGLNVSAGTGSLTLAGTAEA